MPMQQDTKTNETQAQQLNKITAEGVGAVISAAKEDKKALCFTYESNSVLERGFVSNVTLPQGHALVVDEPTTMPGGQNAGPNPLDLLCASFGTCQEITYKMYAAALGITLASVSADVTGSINLNGLVGNGGPIGLTKVRGVVTVESDAPEEKLRQLKAAADAHCPLLATLRGEVPIAVSLEHRGIGTDAGAAAETLKKDPVQKAGLMAVIAAGKEDPKALMFENKSTSKLDTDTLATKARMQNGHELLIDEPASMPGGNNQGPNPLDVFCASLGTCQEITWKMFGQVQGIPIAKVSCAVKGPIDLRGLVGLDDSAVAFKKMEMKVTVDSPAGADQISALQKAAEASCPMVWTIRNKIEVELELKIKKPQ